MSFVWDVKADIVNKGDNLRDILPLREYIDKSKLKHYIFSKEIFHNPRYIIPADSFTLFYNFLNGGSREYPSDGNIPVDVVAEEARIILNSIKEIAGDTTHKFYSSAKNLLIDGENKLVRGTIKLYLGEYTTRDWRRKRSTDDIDFWISDNILLEYVLSKTGWFKNKNTKEWEKKIRWTDVWTGKVKSCVLIVSNDLVQGLDFGSGSYLEGSNLKDIIKKKIIRGHDVDLSDIINVAIVNNIPYSTDKNSPWAAIDECANMRHERITSNLISLCRYSHGIANYLKRVGEAMDLYKNLVLNPFFIHNTDIIRICKISSHWLKKQNTNAVDDIRERIYNNLLKQSHKKLQYFKSLRNFGYRLFDLLNAKYKNARIIFEIEE